MKENRESPRIEVFEELYGRAILLDEPVRITQMSLGGLTIETRFPFKVGSSHDFQLTVGTRSATVRGRVRHWRVSVDSFETVYVSGIEFVDVTEELSAWIRQFMESLQVADG